MKSKASAPGKIILFGEHFVIYGVKAILCAIDKRITVTAKKIPQNCISITSNIGKLSLPINKPLNEIDSSLKPIYFIANKMIKNYNLKTGLEVLVESEIPVGVGLGSSSASCVASAAALCGLFGEKSKDKILALAIEAEKTIFPNTSGADCTVCTFGGIIEYDKNIGYTKLDLDSNFNFVIINSKKEHSTKEIVSKVEQFKEKNNNKFFNLCDKESKLITKVLDFLRNGDLAGIGAKMLENQRYLKKIGVSDEKLDEILELAKKSSYGAKITGAGGGGCIIALVDESNLKKVSKQFKNESFENFPVKIDFDGCILFNKKEMI